MKKISLLLVTVVLVTLAGLSQEFKLNDSFLRLDAQANDPLYTTYTAAMERSRLYGDKGYKMDYYSCSEPLQYQSDRAGRIYSVWKIDKLVVQRMDHFDQAPVIHYSFPDMAIMSYRPFQGIHVDETFWVYSSRVAMVRQTITNHSDQAHLIEVYPVFETGNEAIKPVSTLNGQGLIVERTESLKRLISNLYADAGYPRDVRDLFYMADSYSWGSYTGGMNDFYDAMKTDFYARDYKNDRLNQQLIDSADFVALHAQFTLQPGESREIVWFRGIQKAEEDPDDLLDEIRSVDRAAQERAMAANEQLFASVPRISFDDRTDRIIYIGAFNLARGCMLPPTGEAAHNFYVFSREPKWGWGHGHQVLHESLSMLSYAWMDGTSAEGSQRIYMDQQGEDGLIAYRHGPRGPQTYPHKNRPTTSAPFYSWINWEVYSITRNPEFLADSYASGVKYMNWLKKERDLDQDGTFEWGPYGIIENVRDWYNAVFQVSEDRYLDVDKEDISDELECLDLSLMVCKEMRCLADMADELGKDREARKWEKEADELAALINERMWDEETGFYYSINMKDHSFQFLTRDLRRQEIIGFLPLWAEACTPERAEELVAVLTDTTRFWRRFGVPTLAANDVWYSPNVDYCCKWNGPVWLLWNYMIFDGLLNYGYVDLARELKEKIVDMVGIQLSRNHNFWESFSPDNTVNNSPSNYIWDTILTRFYIDLEELE